MTEVKTYNLLQIGVPIVFGVVIIGLSAYFLHKLGEVNSKTEEMVEIISNQQKILIKHEDAIAMIVDNINQRHHSQPQNEYFDEEPQQDIPNSTPGKTVSFNLDDEILDELNELNDLNEDNEEECEGGICKIKELTDSELDEKIENKEKEIDDLEEEINELNNEIKDINDEIKDIKKSNDE